MTVQSVIEHIRQSTFDMHDTPMQHLMRVPPMSRLFIEGFLRDKCFVFSIPLHKRFDPEMSIIGCHNAVEQSDYLKQFPCSLTLRFTRYPCLNLPGDMYRASLQYSLRTYFPHRFEYVGCTVTSYAFDLDACTFDILKVLFEFTEPLTVGQPIEDRHMDIGIPIKHQTDLVGEVGSVDQQIHFLPTLDVPEWTPRKLLVEITFQMPNAVSATFRELFDALLADDPFAEPDCFIAVADLWPAVGKIALAIRTIITLEPSMMAIVFGAQKSTLRAANLSLY